MKGRGFTLIELMVVIVILGILATIVVPKFLDRAEQARVTAARVQTKNFEQALGLFKLDNGFFPSTEQGFSALVEMPVVGELPANWKQYLKDIPADPWGRGYIYLCPGIYNEDYDIISFGRDGAEGGEGDDADIIN